MIHVAFSNFLHLIITLLRVPILFQAKKGYFVKKNIKLFIKYVIEYFSFNCYYICNVSTNIYSKQEVFVKHKCPR